MCILSLMFILILFLIIGSVMVYLAQNNLMLVTLHLGTYVLSDIPLFYIIVGSLLIVAFGMFIDLDHRRIIERFLNKISRGKISLEPPKHIVHICHTWQFATGLFLASSILFMFGFRDLSILIYISYFTHMLIDALGKSGPNPSNLFPAEIHRFIAKLFS